MGIFSKTKKSGFPAHVSFDSGLFVVVDPADGTQTIYPEPGALYLVENKGIERALYFEKYDGEEDAGNCQKCSLGGEQSEWAKTVCRKMCCLDPNCDVYAKEYIVDADKGCYVPKPEFKANRVDDDFDFDAPNVDADAPCHPACAMTADEKRAAWENALKELDEQARAHEVIADDLKTRAKKSLNYSKQLRAKMYELLSKGSENYTSDTPLFEGIDDLESEADNVK